MENTQTPPPESPKWSKPIVGRLYTKTSKSTDKKFLAGFVNFTDDFGVKKSMEICIYPNRRKLPPDQNDGRVDCDYFIYYDNYRDAKAQNKPQEQPKGDIEPGAEL
jgi:hypothetical protein